jgi:HK97 family phage major capsid protein
MTPEELRLLIAQAEGERKAELEAELAAAEKKAAEDASSTAARDAETARAAAEKKAADEKAAADKKAADEAAAKVGKPNAANANAAKPGFERVAAIEAAEAAGDVAAATALRSAPPINGSKGVTQFQLDAGVDAAAPRRYRHSRYHQAAARGKDPRNIVRKYEPDDQALAVTVIGLHQFLANGDRAGARRWMMERTLSEGIGAAGGFLVPDEFAQDVIMQMGELTVFGSTEFLRVFPMSTDVMKVPVLDTRPDVDVIPENTSGDTGTDPAVGQVELVARKFGRVLPLSEELVADASIAMLEFLRDLYAEILAEKRTEMVTNGTGAGQPEGVRQSPDVTTTAFAGVQTNAADVLDWIEAIFWGIKSKYKTGGQAIWLASQAMLETLSTVKDGNGRPILSQITDQPFQRLKGAPIFENNFIPDTLGAGANQSELIFGNFKFYTFGDRQQMRVATDAGGLYFRDDQIAFKVTERYDGRVGQAEAFIRGTGKTVS